MYLSISKGHDGISEPRKERKEEECVRRTLGYSQAAILNFVKFEVEFPLM